MRSFSLNLDLSNLPFGLGMQMGMGMKNGDRLFERICAKFSLCPYVYRSRTAGHKRYRVFCLNTANSIPSRESKFSCLNLQLVTLLER